MLNELVNTGIKETPVEIVIVYSNKWIIKKNFSFDGDSNLLESVDKFIKGMVEGAKDLEKLGKTPEQYKDVLYDEYKTKLETYIPIVKDYINKTESINNDHILEQEVSQFDLYEEEKNQNNETGQQISGDVENHDTF